MTEKAKSTCRVCLRSVSKLKKCRSLFEEFKNILISDIINSIANVGIQEGDGLPTKICPKCFLELDTALTFKTKCEASNILLRIPVSADRDIVDTGAGEEVKQSDFKEAPCADVKKEEPIDDYAQEEFLDDDFFAETSDVEPDIKYELVEEKVKLEEKVKRSNIKANLKLESQDCGHKPLEDQVKLKENAKKSKAIDLKLECHDCGGFFKSKCKLKVHWKKVHLPEKLICQMCKQTFKKFLPYNRHVASKKSSCMIAAMVNIEGTGKLRVFCCKDCDYKTKNNYSMKVHLNRHTGERPYICKICNTAFTQLSALYTHQEGKHKMIRKEITCEYCSQVVRGRDRIYKHLLRHKGNTVQCDICKKILKSKQILVNHLKHHAEVKGYRCDLCAKSYYTYADLSTHKRLKHENLKPRFECDICGYNLHKAVMLEKHKAKHIALGNLFCKDCYFFFQTAEELEQHQMKHKRFSCLYCNKKYNRNDNLVKHLRVKHQIFPTNSKLKPKEVKTENLPLRTCNSMIEVEVNAIGT